MCHNLTAALVVLTTCSASQANIYRVTNRNNSGPGSLRRAINQANGHVGPDRIRFRATLAGSAILPSTELPKLTDDSTLINGDLNGDGAPDIAVNGRRAGAASGLIIEGDGCTIVGLAITNFAGDGIRLVTAENCVIRSCHVGVNLLGTRAVRNGGHQIYLLSSHRNTIGGPRPAGRNIIAAGSASPERAGIYVSRSSANHIRNCNIGIARDGLTSLTGPKDSGVGIQLCGVVVIPFADGKAADGAGSFSNVIGGTPAERNVLGGMRTGIRLTNADDNFICSNYLGLGRDGNTAASIADQCIDAELGSQRNVIGGQWNVSGNVLASSTLGVVLRGSGTEDNHVQGNYFGLNAAGTRQRPLAIGVFCTDGAGTQEIGEIVDQRWGNVLCPNHPSLATHGVLLYSGGAGSSVHLNRIGIRPDARLARAYDRGVTAFEADADILGNLFCRADEAVYCYGTPGTCRIVFNDFRRCGTAVRLRRNSRAMLGNPGSSDLRDKGENYFHRTNTWYIRNETPNYVKAEGNHFPAGFYFEIDAKIWDRKDIASLGVVDYLPGHFDLPSAGSVVSVTGAAASQTALGAEITFSLSAAASVTASVVNIAGRPVATVARDQEATTGTQQILWDARTDQGAPVPSGHYLVRITARGADGTEAQRLVPLRIVR